MQQQLPAKYQAVYLEAPGKPLEVREFDLPKLEQEGDVLVKVESAPINPSDQMYTIGAYSTTKPYPCTPGFEGSGIVVQGKGEKAQALVGKRVGFTPKNDHFTGTYGEYCVSTIHQALPVSEKVSFDVAASSFINPYTVVCMLETAKTAGVKAVVHTAAASQLGRMMNKYFSRNGVQVINVVRKQEQVEVLQKLGAKHILKSTDSDFEAQLSKLSAELGATIAYDAVAGPLSGQVLNAMPNNSTLYVYGGLSGQNSSGIGIGDLIFKGKTLQGYWLATQFFTKDSAKQAEISQTVASLLDSDFKSDIGKDFSYKSANEAIKYYLNNMTSGKPVIRYNGSN